VGILITDLADAQRRIQAHDGPPEAFTLLISTTLDSVGMNMASSQTGYSSEVGGLMVSYSKNDTVCFDIRQHQQTVRGDAHRK
jgi:hypothetical protein